jgi:PAS domain S-box-containing protein
MRRDTTDEPAGPTDGTGTDTGAEQGRTEPDATVLLLVADEGNRSLLDDWLVREGYTLADADTDDPLAAEFDLAIVDEAAFERHRDALSAATDAAAPVILPLLLLVSESGTPLFELDRDRLVDSVVWNTVNDVLAVPVKRVELLWRIESLLGQRRQSTELQETLDGLNDPVFVCRPDGSVLSVNRTAVDRYGRTEAELCGTTLWDLEPDADERRAAERRRALGRDGQHVYETVHETRSGDRLPVEVNASCSQFRGRPAVLATVRDITDRRAHEREARRFRRAVEAAGHAVFLTDTDGAIQYVNPAFEEITGYSREEAVGRTPAILNSGEMSEPYYEALWETILAGEVWEEEVVNRRADGTLYTAHQTIAPIVSDGIEAFVAIQTDVTERAERERQLQLLDRVLRHNIHNDLNAVQGWAELIEAEGEPPLTGYARRIVDTTGSLVGTMDKERRITKLLKDEPRVETLDLVALLEPVVESVRAEFPSASVTFSAPERARVRATTDVELAVHELLHNAIEHDDGESAVRTELSRAGSGVEVRVADDGPPIPEMELQALTGEEETQLYHGSGLGLWFVHLVARRCGASLDVPENGPDGTVVRLRFHAPEE